MKKTTKTRHSAMRIRSGKVTSDDRLVEFLYDLMICSLTPGAVETLMSKNTGKQARYTNGWVAQYAKDVAKRLQEKP